MGQAELSSLPWNALGLSCENAQILEDPIYAREVVSGPHCQDW